MVHSKLMSKFNDKLNTPFLQWKKSELILFHTYIHTFEKTKQGEEYNKAKEIHSMMAKEMQRRNMKHPEFNDAFDEEVETNV